MGGDGGLSPVHLGVPDPSAGWGFWLLEVFLRNVLLALMIYAHLTYLLPGFLQSRNLFVYLAGLVLSFFFYVLVKNTHDVFQTVYTATPALPFWRYSFYNFSIALFYMAFSTALHLSKEWYLQRVRMRELEVEKLTTELEYLKAQINPHLGKAELDAARPPIPSPLP